MIIEMSILLGCLALAIITIFKTWNIINRAEIFNPKISMVALLIAVIFWGFSFFGYLGSIGDQSVSTIIDGASTITVTQTQNAFVYLEVFMDIQNYLISVILILTIVEAMYWIKLGTVGRKEGRSRENRLYS